MGRLWLWLLLGLGCAAPTWAGEITLYPGSPIIRDKFVHDHPYWHAWVLASSTVPWPGWIKGQRVWLETPQAVRESGLMVYRESQLHHFVWTGPTHPDVPGLQGRRVRMTDSFKKGRYYRRWEVYADDAVATVEGVPMDYVLTPPDPLFAPGDRAVLHLADVDTIDAMLNGDFGPPLAHRRTDPCRVTKRTQGLPVTTECALALPDDGE
jgi:hypothetical protein